MANRATVAVHWDKGVWQAKGGIELTLTNLAAAVAIGLTGPGRFSLDAALGSGLSPALAYGATALAALAVLVAFLGRRPAPAQQPAPAGGRS